MAKKSKIKGKKVVAVGGGTGTFIVLSGLKKYPLELSVIVSMMDSGGSNRIIRDEFGLLPTSDIRQCMVALASKESHELLRKLFTYRYNQGTGISGMTFGNLFMAALTDLYGSQEEAIRRTCEILDVEGEIIPVTYNDSHLVARYSNGKEVLGEHLIDEPIEGDLGEHRIVDLELMPKADANKTAIKAISEADLIILGPGDLYTSIICNLVVDGISGAIKRSSAKKAFVLNLMTKYGETHKFTAQEFVNEIEEYLGNGVIDYALINKSANFPKGILKRYREERAYPVIDNLKDKDGLKVVRRSFVSSKVYKKPKGDKLKRSLIRHDPAKLARAIVSVL